jgi:hypothetical protein
MKVLSEILDEDAEIPVKFECWKISGIHIYANYVCGRLEVFLSLQTGSGDKRHKFE